MEADKAKQKIDEIVEDVIKALPADEEILYICSPVTDTAHVDSSVAKCSKCGTHVWISNRADPHLPQRTTIMCVDCGLKTLEEQDEHSEQS